MAWKDQACSSCQKPIDRIGWFLKDGLKCEHCYKRLRKQKKFIDREKQKEDSVNLKSTVRG